MKKLKDKEIRALLTPLPKKMRAQIMEEEITEEYLYKEIALSKQAMKNDLMLGIPWSLMYFGSLYFTGLDLGTALIFLLGASYFLFFTYKRGTYGMNKKKIEIFEEILVVSQGNSVG